MNRIVINYGMKRSVVYLTSFTVDGTEYLEIDEMKCLGFDVVTEFKVDANGLNLTAWKALNETNKEGFVIRYNATGERVKIKFENYIAMHRVITNITVKSVYEMFKNGNQLSDMLINIPDEFNDWFKQVYDNLTSQYELIDKNCLTLYNEYKDKSDKECGLQINNQNKMKKIIFGMRNNINNSVITKWKMELLDWENIPNPTYENVSIHTYTIDDTMK